MIIEIRGARLVLAFLGALLLPFFVALSIAHTSALTALAQTKQSPRQESVGAWPASSKRYALVIGVDQYADTQITTLGGAANDAKTLADALVRYAGFPSDQVILLATDQPQERQPTRGNILRRLSNLATSVPADGLILVSFAGHGIERKGQAYLLPSDAQLSNDIDLLEDTAINVVQIKERVRKTGVAQVVFILDACRNDPVGRGDTDNPLTASYTRGLNFDVRNREVKAFVTLYATAVGHRAYEYKEKRQGYFTWELIQGLKGAAANGRGEVTLSGLVKYLQEQVPKHVLLDLGEGKEQKPFVDYDGYNPEELVIAAVNKNGGASSEAATPFSNVNSAPAFEPYAKKGDALRLAGNWTAAETEYRIAVRLNPTNAGLRGKFATALSRNGKYSEAEKEFAEVARLAPNGSDAAFGEALSLMNRGKNPEAETVLRRLLSEDKSNVEWRRVLVYALGHQKKWNDAEAEAREALTLIHDKASYEALLFALSGQDKNVEIEALIRDLIRQNPDDASWHNQLAHVLASQKSANAEQEYRAAISLDPQNVQYRLELASFLNGLGQLSQAEAEYKEIIRLNPRYAGIASEGLLDIYIKQSRWAEAEAIVKSAISNGGSVGLYQTLTKAQVKQGNYAGAEMSYREAMRLEPRASSWPAGLGLLLADERKYAEAEEAFRKALQIDPQSAELHNDLGLMLYYQGKKAEALAEVQEANRLAPYIQKYRDTLNLVTSSK